jgi:hypothetical protein
VRNGVEDFVFVDEQTIGLENQGVCTVVLQALAMHSLSGAVHRNLFPREKTYQRISHCTPGVWRYNRRPRNQTSASVQTEPNTVEPYPAMKPQSAAYRDFDWEVTKHG